MRLKTPARDDGQASQANSIYSSNSLMAFLILPSARGLRFQPPFFFFLILLAVEFFSFHLSSPILTGKIFFIDQFVGNCFSFMSLSIIIYIIAAFNACLYILSLLLILILNSFYVLVSCFVLFQSGCFLGNISFNLINSWSSCLLHCQRLV